MGSPISYKWEEQETQDHSSFSLVEQKTQNTLSTMNTLNLKIEIYSSHSKDLEMGITPKVLRRDMQVILIVLSFPNKNFLMPTLG